MITNLHLVLLEVAYNILFICSTLFLFLFLLMLICINDYIYFYPCKGKFFFYLFYVYFLVALDLPPLMWEELKKKLVTYLSLQHEIHERNKKPHVFFSLQCEKKKMFHTPFSALDMIFGLMSSSFNMFLVKLQEPYDSIIGSSIGL